VRQKLEVLHGHCETLGRDPKTIAVSTSLEDIHLLKSGEDPNKAADWTKGRVSLENYKKRYKIVTADELTERIQGIVDAGADNVLLYFGGLAYNQEMLHTFASDVMPRFA
jgi:hypothetical protein